MRLLIEKFHALGIGWNERPLTERDAEALCGRLNVTLDERPLTINGFYYRIFGRDFIAIDSRLRGPQRLAVLFHELAHCLFHAPASGATAGFHNVGRKTRQEREADLFALCAVIPRAAMLDHSADQLLSDGFSPEMIGERCALFERYGV